MNDKPMCRSVSELFAERERDPYSYQRKMLEGLKHWKYDPDSKRLCLIEWNYTIPLNRCNSNAAIVDWVCQLARKTQLSVEIVGEFVIAINALLTPQMRMCGGAMSSDRGKDIDAERIAAGVYSVMMNPPGGKCDE